MTPSEPPMPTPLLRFRLLTTFGLGHLPISGTWGSLPPPIIAGILIAIGLGPIESPGIYHIILLAILLVFSAACILYGDHAEARFGSKDPGQVVADETAAQCIPLMFLPAAALATPALTAFTIFYAFIAFRIFDIVKPWPARTIQATPGGWGILLDDLIAGVYALIFLQAAAILVL
jgi:phosphatidylglycerophosphatase A